MRFALHEVVLDMAPEIVSKPNGIDIQKEAVAPESALQMIEDSACDVGILP